MPAVFSLLKPLAGVACALLVWEGLLRVFASSMPGFYTHPELGRIYQPGTLVQGMEGYAKTRINSLGMRGDEIGPKVAGERRVLALGDSFTEALQVADEQTYCARLSHMLGWRVINGGRSGASPAFYLHLADFYRRTLAPDVTVIQLNDDDFNTDALNETRNFYLVAHEAGFETVKNPAFVSANGWLARFPQLGVLMQSTALRLGAEKVQKALQARSQPAAPAAPAPPLPPTLLPWFTAQVRAKYPEAVLLYLPEEQHPPSAIEKALAAAAAKAGLGWINMRPEFEAALRAQRPARGFNNTSPGDGHINELGHRLVAEKLARQLGRERRP